MKTIVILGSALLVLPVVAQPGAPLAVTYGLEHQSSGHLRASVSANGAGGPPDIRAAVPVVLSSSERFHYRFAVLDGTELAGLDLDLRYTDDAESGSFGRGWTLVWRPPSSRGALVDLVVPQIGLNGSGDRWSLVIGADQIPARTVNEEGRELLRSAHVDYVRFELPGSVRTFIVPDTLRRPGQGPVRFVYKAAAGAPRLARIETPEATLHLRGRAHGNGWRVESRA